MAEDQTGINVDTSALEGTIVVVCEPPQGTSTPAKDHRKDDKICDKCGSKYKTTQGMIDHMSRVHHGKHRRTCQVSKKGFVTSTCVRSHVLMHVQEKQYKCDLCQKKYAHKKDLAGHMKAKHEMNAFKCSVCDKAFAYQQGPRSHAESQHQGKQFYCLECNSTYTFRSNFRRHMKQKHCN